MPKDCVQADLDLAIRLTREAARVAVGAFASPVDVREKADGTPVTATDLAIEDLIRARLAEQHPLDAVIGEERPPRTGGNDRRWIVDPIGGTVAFSRRIPLFSVDLALEDAYGPAVAVSALPASGQLMAAGRRLGCWVLSGDRDPRPEDRARVSARTELTGAAIAAHGTGNWPRALWETVRDRCAIQHSALSVLRLITGDVDAVLVPLASFGYDDLAGLPVLVGEAGGRVTDLSGEPVLRGDGTVLASNGLLHDAILELIS